MTRPMPGTLLLRHVRPTQMDATMYEPVLCTILQGSKETTAGATQVNIRAGESLIVSHDVPVVSAPSCTQKMLFCSSLLPEARDWHGSPQPTIVTWPSSCGFECGPAAWFLAVTL